MSKSSIEWTEHTWNPVVGCSIVSPGCTHCYAMKMAARIEAMGTAAHYIGMTKKVNGNAVWTGKVALAPEAARLAPLRRKKPTTYFVNSMGDLFHEDIPDEWIDRVFAIMALSPQHTFQVLTKRSARMREYLTSARASSVGMEAFEIVLNTHARDHGSMVGDGVILRGDVPHLKVWPLPNVWLGVSTERQQEADERIPDLLATPAAVRFISAEPLLGPIDITAIKRIKAEGFLRPLDGRFRTLDWVIVGGESGDGARPMHPDWARSLRDQCTRAGVAFFFKQWGNWHPEIDRDRDDPDWRQPYSKYREPAFQILNLAGGRGFHGDRVHVMRSCSKASAGRSLDGLIHDEYPEAAARG